jgi:CRISPR type III-B/RAMP module RAMP protein Cmr1
MNEKTFKVEIITPTIMGGSKNSLDTIKIRPSEIKSMMRYAFRLIAGKYIDHSNEINKLLEEEGKIFGDTKQKSDFKIIVDNTDNLKTKKVNLLPHKNNFKKSAILPNQTFDLTLISNKYQIEFYESLLKIAFLLGVGNRRNRLMGNLQITDSNIQPSEDVKVISEECKKLFKKNEEIKTNNPKFPSFTFREDNKKNYLVYSIPLKNAFIKNEISNFEAMLKELYEKIIHKIESNNDYSNIIGSASPRQRQASYINFSLQKIQQNSYRLCLISFYYENNRFEYNVWEKATEEVKKLTEETFKRGEK